MNAKNNFKQFLRPAVMAGLMVNASPHFTRNNESYFVNAIGQGKTAKSVFFEQGCGDVNGWTQGDSDIQQSNKYIIYGKTSFCYDKNVYINFKEPLQLEFKDGNVILQPAGITFECRNIKSFDKALIRFVQGFMDRPLDEELNSDDKKTWLAMLELFDYRQFRLDMATPLYEQFEVKSISKSSVSLVRVPDGKKYICHVSISPVFSNGRINRGDMLGAVVKRNHNDMILELREPRLVHEEFLTDEDIDEITVI